MIGELVLSLALGQAPPAPMPQGAVPMPAPKSTGSAAAAAPAVPAPATAAGPLTSSTGERLVPNGDGTYRIDSTGNGAAANGAGTTGAGNDAEKKENEAEPADEPTKYALQRLLERSPAGQMLSENGYKIYGWTAMNYTGGSTRRSNLPTTFNDRDDFYQMNQNYLVVEKTIDTEKKEVQFGFQTDLILPGTDSRFTIARGLLESQLRSGRNGGPENYPIDLFQAYGTVFLPDLLNGTTVKVGKFATHLEYELVQAPLTPFLTRSFLFQYNPFTHTGVWATSQLNDDWSIGNGAAVGNDNFIDPTNRLTYLGQLKYAPKEGKTQVIFGTSITNPKYDTAEAFAHYNVYNFQLIHAFNDKLSYVMDASYSHMDNFPGAEEGFGNRSVDWFGFVHYLFYKHTDKLTSNFRVELFNDSEGIRTGTEGLYTGVGYNLQYAPCDALILRPFVQFVHNKNNAFEGNNNLYTGGLEAIFRW